MAALTAATWVSALLLIVAGVRKITRPAPTEAALHGARLPSDARLVRTLGTGEIAIGVAVAGGGGRLAAGALAVTYAGFAVFAERQRRQGAGCGCFGATSTPATRLHVGVNIAASAVAVMSLLHPPPSLVAMATAAPLVGALMLGALAVGVHLLRLLLTEAPDLSAAAALVSPRADA